MKNLMIGFICILFPLNLFGQSPENSDSIVNVLTDKHVRFLGTHVYLVPPNNYNYMSLMGMSVWRSGKTVITVNDSIGKSFEIEAEEFSKKVQSAEGAKGYVSKEFKINNYTAKFFHKGIDSNKEEVVILFGDSTFSVKMLIMFTKSTVEQKIPDEIFNCLLSAIVDKKVKVGPFDKVRYEFDLSKSDTKLVKNPFGTFVFSMDTTKDASYFTVVEMPYEEATDEKLLARSNEMVMSTKWDGIKDLKLDSKKIKIEGNDAIESSGYGTKNGIKLLYYLLVIGKQNNGIVITGYIKSDFEQNLEKMIKLTHSIKLK